ncbi:hypothetical protein V500_08014 [Pseudogymnoascus sp. VKM F-4518 (FW-2643)]|nr:hypothetical protein V500_08014 [Pseudogymnoascus sp. VKM F-4518 (FW-2643)]
MTRDGGDGGFVMGMRDGEGEERATALRGQGFRREKGAGTYLAQYGRPVLLQDGVKERYPGNRNINSEPSGAPRSERDFFAAVSGRYGGL